MGNTNSAWRKLEGLEDPKTFVETYKSKIKNLTPPEDRTAILFLGPVGAGKSSLINAFLSVENDSKINIAHAGIHSGSNTVNLAKYPGQGWLKKFLFMDSMGIEGTYGDGFNPADHKFLLQGNIKKNYPFNKEEPINSRSKYYLENPELGNKTHCVVFVLDARTMGGNLPDGHKKKIKSLLNDLKNAGVHGILVLTQCDLLCSDVKKDASYIFKSEKVEKAVNYAREVFDIQKSSIHPVVNFVEDVQLTFANTIPILVALHDILQNACYHYNYVLIEKDVDKENDSNKHDR